MTGENAQYCQFALAPKLASKAAPDLYAQLKEYRGKVLILDGSGVEQIGVLCMQILVSAAQTWREEGTDFEIAEPSAALLDSMKVVGLDLSLAGVQAEWSEADDA